MAASVLLACGLKDKNLDSHIHISEESGIDGNFLLSCILGQQIRIQDSAVILICLDNTFQHYLNVGLRLGYNLKLAKDKNLHIIEPITDISLNFNTSDWTTSENDICTILFENIKNKIENISKNKNRLIIIIDNLEILLNLGANEINVMKFCKSLRKFIETEKEFSTLITKLNNCNVFNVLNSQLISICDLYLNVMKLKSGNFKEVDGKLKIIKTQLKTGYKIEKYEKEILYKVNEKNIRTFNLGEIGIKN